MELGLGDNILLFPQHTDHETVSTTNKGYDLFCNSLHQFTCFSLLFSRDKKNPLK